MKMTSQEFYYKSPEMRETFSYIPEACDAT